GFGRLGVVWDEFTNFGDSWGNIMLQCVYPDDATDPGTYTGAHLVGLSTPTYRNPSIAMSQNTTSNDIATYIVYERDNAGHVDITSRMDDVLIMSAPTFASAPNVGSGSGDQLDPNTMYHTATDSFLTVYHDAASNALVLKGVSQADVMTSNAQTISATFRDASTAMGVAAPRVAGIESGKQFIAWTDNGTTYIDAQAASPAAVQNTSVSISQVQLFPNPASEKVHLRFEAENKDEATITVADMTGKIVYTAPANIDKGSNLLSVALGTLAPGNYALRLSGAHTNTSLLFTVTK
ncbi:MAG: T9SS type A sorting domain-containing protein, partial [Flavipsychrobacter sp.]|nr:T9SS type A sorting domain-containing protein [Flavipsychrobacter sp.]